VPQQRPLKAKNNLILLYEIEGSDVIPLNELKEEDEDTDD
jgi:hypothetical protein